MKLSELLKMHGDCELKDGFMNFVIVPRKGKVYSADEVEDGTTVYYVDTYGGVQVTVFRNRPYQRSLILQGNMFWDEQSARKESKRRKVCHIVEKYSYKFSKEEWENDSIKKWYAYYSHHNKKMDYSRCHQFQCQQLFFKSKNDIQTAISEVGQGDFIKYFLGVEL